MTTHTAESEQGSRPPTSNVTVGCLFAAIGGFCRAFKQAGARVTWANELDAHACETFRLNHPDVRLIQGSVTDVEVLADGLEPVDVLTAGFPCQPFSEAGMKRGLRDERGLLFLHITRLLDEFGRERPKVLLLENVRYFRNHDDGRTFHRVQSEIRKAGYWFPSENAKILDTATHSQIPQNRKRIFMVALSTDAFPNGKFEFPRPLPTSSRRNLREFLDLHKKADDWYYFGKDSQYYPMFVNAIAEGGSDAIYQLRRNYVRKNMSGMCFTLMANMGEGGHNQPVLRDRWGIRKLTLRECARLQGYEDDWFRIPVDMLRSQVLKQIGNSVTVPLVERIARRCVGLLADRPQAELAKTRDGRNRCIADETVGRFA